MTPAVAEGRPAPRRRVYRSPLSRVAWVLAPLGLAALGWGVTEAAAGLPDAWAGLGLALLFFSAAAVFGVTRRSLVLEEGRWHYRRGLLYGGRAGVWAELARVRLGADGDPGSGEGRWRVTLEAAGGELPVLETESAAEARAEAEDLALALGRPLKAPDGTLPPGAVRESVARRLAAAADGVPPSQDPRPVADGAGRLPAPGWRAAAPAAAAGALLLLLAALHLASAALGAGGALAFTLFVLPLEALTGWIVGRSVSAAFAPEEVWIGDGLLTVTRPLSRQTVKLTEVQRIGLGAGRVVVEGAASRVRLGAGLSEEGRRSLAHALAETLAVAAGR